MTRVVIARLVVVQSELLEADRAVLNNRAEILQGLATLANKFQRIKAATADTAAVR